MRSMISNRPRWRIGLVATAIGLVLAACGGAADSTTTTEEAVAEEAVTTTAAPEPATTVAESVFPIVIEHALGTTEIPEEPIRVVAWGWGSADAALALGVVPVGIPFQAYGGDEQGVLPWIDAKVNELGAEMPEILPNGDSVPFEAIAALEPDLILAVYSGITADDYELLSAMAPTVAYPDQPWATPWTETIEIVGTSLGKSDEVATLLADIDQQIAEAAAGHPEFAGKSVAMVWDVAGTFYVYTAADARAQFLEGLGFVTAPSVSELDTGEATFYYTLSYEELDRLESDVLVNFADTQEASSEFLASDRAQLLPQIESGSVAEIVGTELIAAVSPPTALSLSWGLDDYVASLAEAAQSAG